MIGPMSRAPHSLRPTGVNNAGCTVCGTKNVAFGARFNPAPGLRAIYVNFCRTHGLNWQSLPPRSPKKWAGQWGGSYAAETLSTYEPFTAHELESMNGMDGADD